MRKPSKYAHRMPSKTGTSEYNRTFARSMPANDIIECIPNRSKIANNLKLPNNGITNYKSTYSVKHCLFRSNLPVKNRNKCSGSCRHASQIDMSVSKSRFLLKRVIIEITHQMFNPQEFRRLGQKTTLLLVENSTRTPHTNSTINPMMA